jgi:hypothetical protein
MTTISLTHLYSLLSEKVGKETAENLTVYIEEKIKDEVKTQSNTLATKEDIGLVKQDIAALDVKFSEKTTEMIKWMFIFWVGQVVVTFGFILLFLKK